MIFNPDCPDQAKQDEREGAPCYYHAHRGIVLDERVLDPDIHSASTLEFQTRIAIHGCRSACTVVGVMTGIESRGPCTQESCKLYDRRVIDRI